MFELEMHPPSRAFTACWNAAGHHLNGQVQDGISTWLKASLTPPFLEHLSFRLGNQLFLIRVEDVAGRLEIPGSRNGLRMAARGYDGHACLLPMERRPGGWQPAAPGWGLLDLETGAPVDPLAHLSDARIEMTDWELHDFAVQVIRDMLEAEGRQILSSQGNPEVDPSIWFVGATGPEWVVVRAVRYPDQEASRPATLPEIAARCAAAGERGSFAPVAVASAAQDYGREATGRVVPLYRGHAMHVSTPGLSELRVGTETRS